MSKFEQTLANAKAIGHDGLGKIKNATSEDVIGAGIAITGVSYLGAAVAVAAGSVAVAKVATVGFYVGLGMATLGAAKTLHKNLKK